MDQVLHSRLAKRRITPTGGVWDGYKEWMVEATSNGRGSIENPEQGRKDVIILDMMETMARVKIISQEFIDYVHLALDGGQWVIVNVLWDHTLKENR